MSASRRLVAASRSIQKWVDLVGLKKNIKDLHVAEHLHSRVCARTIPFPTVAWGTESRPIQNHIYGEYPTPGDQEILVLYRLQYTIVVFRRDFSRGHRRKREEEMERKITAGLKWSSGCRIHVGYTMGLKGMSARGSYIKV